jgi:hypothetical protein
MNSSADEVEHGRATFAHDPAAVKRRLAQRHAADWNDAVFVPAALSTHAGVHVFPLHSAVVAHAWYSPVRHAVEQALDL